MMKLDEFITETIISIVKGVNDSKDRAKEMGAIVNPRILGGFFGKKHVDSNGYVIETVEFDIALTTNEGTQTKGGIGVFVGPVGVGSQGASNNQNTTVNRIQFSTQVMFSN
jgi:hypothetical protein